MHRTTILGSTLIASFLWPALAGAAPSTPPIAAELGQVCYADGRTKAIAPEDVLWLARMVHGETGGTPAKDEAVAMLWAIAQRSNIPVFHSWSLSRLTYTYSQPISPKWTRTGNGCRQYYAPGYSGKIPENCSASRLERRERYRSLAWEDISPIARLAAVEFAAGELTNPVPGIVGWYDKGEWRAHHEGKDRRLTAAARIRKNVFFTDKKHGTPSWGLETVRMVGPGEACPSGNAGGSSKGEADKSGAATKPALGSCASGFTYFKKGQIGNVSTRVDGSIKEVLILHAGWNDRICDDSTGMIYVDAVDGDFLTDVFGKKVKLKATKVTARTTTAAVVEGWIDRDRLGSSFKVVLRAKK